MGREDNDIEDNVTNMMMTGADNMAIGSEDTLTASGTLTGQEIYLTEERK